jgi:hypothetical protein
MMKTIMMMEKTIMMVMFHMMPNDVEQQRQVCVCVRDCCVAPSIQREETTIASGVPTAATNARDLESASQYDAFDVKKFSDKL